MCFVTIKKYVIYSLNVCSINAMQCECTTSVEYSDNIFSILVSPLPSTIFDVMTNFNSCFY